MLLAIFDMDPTLVHGVMNGSLSRDDEQLLGQIMTDEKQNLPFESRSLFRLHTPDMWFKLRPGARSLLAQIKDLFVPWIYSCGEG
jgi:hypothetical protein